MAEEHRCQAPKLCVNNCGFFGSPTTQNLCSKCYRDLQHKEQQALALNQTFISASSTSSSSSSSSSSAFFPSSPVSVSSPQNEGAAEDATKVEEEEAVPGTAGRQANRCTECRRRVGLTGFKCRCGMTYCGTHRYPEKHECGFDFRSMGREQIAKANPVVKGDKLQKI